MSFKGRISLVLVFFCCALTSSAAESGGQQSGADAQHASYIRGYLSGVWLITLTLPDEDLEICQGNALLPETVTILTNFTQAGEFLSTSDLPPLQVPVFDPSTGAPVLDENNLPVIVSVDIGFGHGLWEKTPRGGFFLQTWRLAKVNGQAVGLAKGQSNAQFDASGKQLSGDIRLQLSLFDGTVFPAACGTMGAVRVSD